MEAKFVEAGGEKSFFSEEGLMKRLRAGLLFPEYVPDCDFRMFSAKANRAWK